MSNPEVELTILMPCLNEEVTLGTCIKKGIAFLEKHHVTGEILIADNGSTDRSVEIAEDLGARVVRIREKGYGNALLVGIREARGKFVIMGDSDDSYDFLNLGLFLEKLREGHDLVMGNRFLGGIEDHAMPPLHRYLGNPVLSFIGRLFFRIPVGDFHCGLRGMNRDAILKIGLNTPGMEFASEMVVKSALNNLRIAEVPTTLSRDGREHPPHLHTWRDGWRHLRFLLLFSPKWLFLYPGLSLFLFGLTASAILMFTPVYIGSARIDIHTLLYTSMLIFTGFQFISFYCFSKVYAVRNDLLPPDKSYTFCLKIFALERGILIGLAFILAGIILTLKGYLIWKGVRFGDLNPSITFRIIIPAITAIMLGFQVIQNCFFISFLTIKK
jgi:glycosyltransferase involved in cell wall biosynthesis